MIERDRGNLLFGEWVPVSWRPDAPADVRRPALGLRELLEHAHLIASIDVTVPPALSALYRVLYALAARVTASHGVPGLDAAPEGSEEWKDRREDVLGFGRFDPDAIRSYFDAYPGRFGLFNTHRPFLQDPRLIEQCPKSAGVNKLVVGRPAGNNHSWFGGHHTDTAPVSVPAAQAFLDLLVWCYYGPSGRCSARSVGGDALANTKSGPLRSTLSYHPVGASLFETLVCGIPMPQEGPASADDLCPWERGELPDPGAVPPETTGVCSLLTARSQHAVLLVPDAPGTAVVDAYITWAWREAVPSEPDPFLIWQWSALGNLYARRAAASRALWRDLEALVREWPAASKKPSRPQIVVDLPDRPGLAVQALGFDQDGQVKDTQFVAAMTPPAFDLIKACRPDLAVRIGDLRVAAEQAGSRLEYACKKAWKEFTKARKVEDCAWSQQAAGAYWPLAEDEFYRRLAAEEFDDLRGVFRRIAEPVFNTVTATATASMRGARAVESARIELFGGRPDRVKTAIAKGAPV